MLFLPHLSPPLAVPCCGDTTCRNSRLLANFTHGHLIHTPELQQARLTQSASFPARRLISLLIQRNALTSEVSLSLEQIAPLSENRYLQHVHTSLVLGQFSFSPLDTVVVAVVMAD